MATNAEIKDFISRCRTSASYFMESVCKIKHPLIGIIPFKLFNYQRTSLTSFRRNRFNIFRKCRQCFLEGSMVWTPIGPRAIETLKPGDLIYSYNEHTGLLDTVPVHKVHNNGMADVLEIRSKTGHRAWATKDHEYFTYTGNVEAGDLSDRHRLIEVNDYPRVGDSPEDYDPIIIGYLLTDGSFKSSIYLANSNWKYLLEFRRSVKAKTGVLPYITKVKSGFNNDSGRNFRVYATSLKKWLQDLGLYGLSKAEKHIPSCVFRWDNRSIAILLNRMFAADGWYSGSHCNEAGIGSQSALILHQIKQLLSRFGINSTFYPATNKNLAKLRIIGSSDFNKFYKQIGIYNKEPRYPITDGFTKSRKKGEVKSVGGSRSGRVFDLEVPPYHNYIVDGAVVHNCGASTLTGIYALWMAMFFANKKILIVSKRDLDAKSFLEENIKLVFNNLPQWMREVWKPTIWNEHEVGFSNGSIIRSLTSSPDTLRSNASSLNIIDEAAFMPDMETMWAGGWSTLQHGGSAIIISTPNGQGNWYWDKWTDAESGDGIFTPILINWWDMDWVIEAIDPISNRKIRIAPTDGIKKCTTRPEIDKWGPYWSPWLENEYRGLVARGEAHLFKQEILGQFLGSGGTVLTPSALANVGRMVDEAEEPQTLAEPVAWTNQATGETEYIDFSGVENKEGLWIWKKPVLGRPAQYKNGRIIDQGEPGHSYVIGVDTATGENNDYSAIEVYDITDMEQVAEYMGRVPVPQLAKMVDWVGRWYNTALVNPERTGIGAALVQDLQNLLYPNLWRKRKARNIRPGVESPTGPGITLGQIGFATSPASKPTLNKTLIEFIGEEADEGYLIRSPRLYKELGIYIRHRNRAGIETKKTGATEGRGNHDDLVIATALAFVAAPDVIDVNPMGMLPLHSKQVPLVESAIGKPPNMEKVLDQSVLLPLTYNAIERSGPTAAEQLDYFTRSLISSQPKVPPSRPKRTYFQK